MSETSFIIYLDDAQQNRYRHWHVWENGHIVAFVVQYEVWINGEWHPVLRYDTAHGYPHRDILHPNGTQTKEDLSHYTNAEVLTIGQRDIVENWIPYRAAYLKEFSQ